MGDILVRKPGLLTTVQDLGRFDYRIYGVSTSGAMDHYALRMSNILVGNPQEEAVLEITLIGPKLEFKRPLTLALTGGNLSPMLNGKPLKMWKVIEVEAGDCLTFGASKSGCRSYLSVSGGFDLPLVMGSKSTFVRGEYGGFNGRALVKGDQLVVRSNQTQPFKGRLINPAHIPEYQSEVSIRYIKGPHQAAFTQSSMSAFEKSIYKVTNDSDRMGYRLEGAQLVHREKADIISDFITAGTIQVPGTGQPIIHMRDCGVSGGYTKIGVVISFDLMKLAQLKPGDRIRFEEISITQAQEIYRENEVFLNYLALNN